jgi:hypothetical protein
VLTEYGEIAEIQKGWIGTCDVYRFRCAVEVSKLSFLLFEIGLVETCVI